MPKMMSPNQNSVSTTCTSPTGQSNDKRSEKISNDRPQIEFLQRDSGKWTRGNLSMTEFSYKLCDYSPVESSHDLSQPKKAVPELAVFFLHTKTLHLRLEEEANLFRRFQIPQVFWTPLAQDASGFFGAIDDAAADGALQSYSTMFRFLVKEPMYQSPSPMEDASQKKITYVWHTLGFFTSWIPLTANVVFCFDLPPQLKDSLLKSLLGLTTPIQLNDPFAVHVVLLEEVISLFDRALWSCRDLVRDLEKNRTSPDSPEPDYIAMHEIARHAIHCSEMLTISIETIGNMIQEHETFFKENSEFSKAAIMPSKQTSKNFRFQLSVFTCLRLRSIALEERLRNEMNLAFHTVAQYDSRTAVRIGKATQADSVAMKTISVLGLVFLPGTFISAIFSTSFFNFTPGQPQRWTVSDKFWVYWAVALPITAVTVACWLAWYRVNKNNSSAQWK